jgi:glycosyltransferase 2 family protein
VTLAVWTVEAGVWLCCADAAGLHVSALEALYLLALASLFVFIPAGPGNVGTLDAAVVFGARAIGRGSAGALSFLILLRLVLIVPITLVGLGFLVARYR